LWHSGIFKKQLKISSFVKRWEAREGMEALDRQGEEREAPNQICPRATTEYGK